MDSEARYMRRKVKAGQIEADHDECALVVHYEVEATVLGELGEPIVAERQQKQQRIRLKTLKEDSNIARLAEEVVEKCKLIPDSKTAQVEALIRELQERQTRPTRSKSASSGSGVRKAKKAAESASGDGGEAQGNGETPSLDRLEQYVERMYDGTEAATQATNMVLQLSRSPANLETLVSNETLVGLLARLLKEEAKRSMDLAINILYVLYAFSSYSQFHPTLSQGSVGSQVLRIIDLESKRHALRQHERRSESEKASTAAEAERADKMADKRHRLVLRKQEKLLYVCFHVLLNLAEDPEIERKMSKKGLVGYLAPMLERDNAELRVLILIFLKKLAIFKDNLPAMRERKVVHALIPLVPSSAEAVLVTSLRLLYNLSFDAKSREAMASEMLPRLVQLLRKKVQLPLVLRVLFNVSCDERARAAICKLDHVASALRKQTLACDEQQLPPELAALAINVATNEATANVMCEGGAMRHLLERLYQTHDVMLLKLLRNLTMHEQPAAAAAPFAADLFAMVQQVDGEELLVELLGLIGNLRLRKISGLAQLVSRYGLVEFLQRQLVPGFAADDVLLEVVVVAGELAADADCAKLLYRSGAVFLDERDADSRATLYSLITEKQEDDEFVLQLLFFFFRLLQVDEPRDAMLQQSQIVIYLLDLLLDQNAAVQRMASRCLDAVSDADEEWAHQIRQRKFQLHNAQWLELVDEDEAEEYQDAVALNSAMQSLHLNAPLDASQLGNDDLGEFSPSPLSPGAEPYDGPYQSAAYEAGDRHVAGYEDRKYNDRGRYGSAAGYGGEGQYAVDTGRGLDRYAAAEDDDAQSGMYHGDHRGYPAYNRGDEFTN